jgi:hypothetical protein
LLVFAAFGATALAEEHRSNRVPLYVQLELKQATASSSAALANGIGVVTSRSGGKVMIRLNSSVELKEAMELLSERPNVKSVTALPPKMPNDVKTIKSVRVLDETIEAYREAFEEFEPFKGDYEGEEEHEGKEGGEEKEIPGLDFLQAYQQYVHERAYPNDAIDYSAQYDAIQQRIQRDSNNFGGAPGVRPLAATSTWGHIGPTNLSIPYTIYYGVTPINGRVTALAVHPTDANTYYIGSPAGGVWKTTNKGVSWTALSDRWPTMGVSSIAINPANPSIVIAGTGDYHGFDTPGIGFMRSSNAGLTWSVATAPGIGSSMITRIVFNPSNPNIVLASAGGGGGDGIWRSTDAGQSWVKVTTGSEDYTDLVRGVDPLGSPVFYAARSGSSPVVKSTDLGATWNPTTAQPATTGNPAIAASPNIPDVLYFLDTDGQAIHKTTTAGASWSNVTNDFPGGYNWSQAWYDWHIYCSTRDAAGTPTDVIYVGLITVVQSINGGTNWRHVGGANFTSTYSGTAIAHNDQHSGTINPTNPNEMLFGNDGGVYRFNYDPTGDTYTWAPLNKNLGISQFYTLAVHPTNSNIVLGGTQDNASPYSSGDLTNWENPGAGDGAGCAINPQNPLNQYNSSQFHGITRTNDGWNNSFIDISPGLSGQSVPFIGRLLIDQNNPRYLYANCNYLNRYDAQSNSWSEKLGNQNFGSQIRCMAVAQGDSNTIYVGGPGYVWKSVNFGATWNQVNPGGTALPNRTVTSISVNPANKNDIIVTLQGTGGGSVWRCANTTGASPTWVSVSGNLPSLGVNTFVRHPDAPTMKWYVGTDIGVYRTENGGTTWTDYTAALGLPNVLVNELNITAATATMTAATFGRGMWQISIAANSPPLTSLTFNPASVASGSTSTGTIVLTAAAPVGGATINLSSNNAAVVVPVTVTVPAGQTSTTFIANTTSTPSTVTATVTATSSTNSVTGTLTVTPPTILSLSIVPISQTSGFTATGTVRISSPAGAGGINVSLSSNSGAASVPATVNVPNGSQNGTFLVTCNTVAAPTVATITATLAGSTKTAQITVLPPNSFVVFASSFVPSGATVFEGDINSTYISDDVRLGFMPTNLNMKFVALDFLGTSPVNTLSQMSVKIEASCDDPKVNLGVSAYNYTKNAFVQIGTIASSAADASATFTITNPSQFVSPTTRQMRLRVEGQANKGATTNWKARIDLLQWNLKG